MNSSIDKNLIVRIAAKGDGVTGDGRHIAFSAPLDQLNGDGGLIKGPHHVEAPCRHFRTCGGCSLQQLDESSYRQFILDRVNHALEGQGLAAAVVHPPQISAPFSRIRVSLRAAKLGGQFKIGFSAAGSHRIIDLKQCDIMHPALFALIEPLRHLLKSLARRKYDMNIDMTLADQGVDLLISNYEPEGLEERERLSSFAQLHGVARLSVDSGFGPETQWEPEPVTVTIGETIIALPHGSFLQATIDGRDSLVSAMRTVVGDSRLVADLFAGLGTFAFALDPQQKVYAAEGARDALQALQMAANHSPRQIFSEHRDLYRRPLSPAELNRFDAVILDPPRAGARDQIGQLAQSQVAKICYISCNPASFARDAKQLSAAGYKLDQLWPVGQFLWSTHVELVAGFSR